MTMGRILFRRILHTAVSLWLGIVMPLLCVPDVTSDHDHGPHLALVEGTQPSAGVSHTDTTNSLDSHGLEEPERPTGKSGGAIDRFAYTTGFPAGGAEHQMLSLLGLLTLAAFLLLAPTLSGRARRRASPNAASMIPPRPWRPPCRA